MTALVRYEFAARTVQPCKGHNTVRFRHSPCCVSSPSDWFSNIPSPQKETRPHERSLPISPPGAHHLPTSHLCGGASSGRFPYMESHTGWPVCLASLTQQPTSGPSTQQPASARNPFCPHQRLPEEPGSLELTGSVRIHTWPLQLLQPLSPGKEAAFHARLPSGTCSGGPRPRGSLHPPSLGSAKPLVQPWPDAMGPGSGAPCGRSWGPRRGASPGSSLLSQEQPQHLRAGGPEVSVRPSAAPGPPTPPAEAESWDNYTPNPTEPFLTLGLRSGRPSAWPGSAVLQRLPAPRTGNDLAPLCSGWLCSHHCPVSRDRMWRQPHGFLGGQRGVADPAPTPVQAPRAALSTLVAFQELP